MNNVLSANRFGSLHRVGAAEAGCAAKNSPLLYTTPKSNVKKGYTNTDGVKNVSSANRFGSLPRVGAAEAGCAAKNSPTHRGKFKAAKSQQGYTLRAVQLHPDGGQFGFVWPPARTVRRTPMGVHRTCGEPNEIKINTHLQFFTTLVGREQANPAWPELPTQQ